MIFLKKFAWQVELFCFCFCTSPDAASLKGGRVMCEGKLFLFGMCEPKMFCMSYFQTNLKPNDSDVKHCSLVKHSFFCSRNTGVRETQQ